MVQVQCRDGTTITINNDIYEKMDPDLFSTRVVQTSLDEAELKALTDGLKRISETPFIKRRREIVPRTVILGAIHELVGGDVTETVYQEDLIKQLRLTGADEVADAIQNGDVSDIALLARGGYLKKVKRSGEYNITNAGIRSCKDKN